MEEIKKIEVVKIESEHDFKTVLEKENFGFFIFCVSGHAKLQIDLETVEFSSNTVVHILSSSTTKTMEVSSQCNITIVAYNNDAKLVLSAHSLIIFCPVTGLLQSKLNPEEFSDLLFYTTKIEKSINKANHIDMALLNLILIVKELSALNNLENSQRRLKNEFILSFNNLLDQNFAVDKSVESYCEQLHISPKKMYRAFKEDLGISPKEFVSFKLNMESKKLLTHSSLSIKEIAFQMGFQSQYYFSNFFKKINAVSPSQYKEQMSDYSIRMS